MPRKSLSTPDLDLKWRKRKRNASPSPSTAADHSDDSYSPDENGEGDTAVPKAAADHANDEILAGAAAAAADPVLGLRGAEVLSSAEVISVFPAVTRRTVNRPHPFVLAVVAAERSTYAGDASAAAVPPALENISHGQLQVLSGVRPDHPSLSTDPDKPSSYVCMPPPLLEGYGVPMLFQGRYHVVPRHSDWFSSGTVHRLERQVVPHFFTGKSPEHTPEKYMALRNKVIAKYLENQRKRLALAECQGLVVNTSELYDLSRIFRFLDTWGIINYLADGGVHWGLRMAASFLREEPAGELQLRSAQLKSIDGLISFDRPKCSLLVEGISSVASFLEAVDFDTAGFAELEGKINERLAENSCSYCLQSLCGLHYQSQKEVDIALCSDCFHHARYITGHSSLDFHRVDRDKDGSENDLDNWTAQETLLLLEGIEKHNENWNNIAEHVGTKSKAQCIYHFLRLPVENSLLENIEVPDGSMPFRGQSNGYPHSDSNDSPSGNLPQSIQHGIQPAFTSSSNPVMSLVAFLASTIGPRVAASCASAVLSVLTREDGPRSSESLHAGGGGHGTHLKNCDHNGASSSISPLNVMYAAMCGLSAAAMKSKLIADQEEREIQRLAATVINHQLKKLELKLKQFAEIETLLLKECEQAERVRQRISADRIKVMSARLSSTGNSLPGGSSSTMALNSMNIRPRSMTLPAAYADNMQGHGRPQMPFMQRQPQMLSFGPSLPISAIRTQPSAQAPSITLNSAMPASLTHSHHHQLFRSSSGNNYSLG